MNDVDVELVELHDADVERVTLSASGVVIDLRNIGIYLRESDGKQGCWLHDGRMVARNIDQITMTSPGGLAMEADCLYEATFAAHGEVLDLMAVLRGVSDCVCTFNWGISGTSLQFHAQVVQWEIDANGKRLGTWDPNTRTMHP